MLGGLRDDFCAIELTTELCSNLFRNLLMAPKIYGKANMFFSKKLKKKQQNSPPSWYIYDSYFMYACYYAPKRIL
jgi:hypothetical protein